MLFFDLGLGMAFKKKIKLVIRMGVKAGSLVHLAVMIVIQLKIRGLHILSVIIIGGEFFFHGLIVSYQIVKNKQTAEFFCGLFFIRRL